MATEKVILADISAAQGHDIDFDLVADSRLIVGAICQASNGQKGRDPTFVRNFRELKRVGLLRGAYHFAHCDADNGDATLEAANFVSAVCLAAGAGSPASLLDVLDSEDVLLALDIETNNGSPKLPPGPAFVKWVHTFCKYVEDTTGIVPAIYTGGPFFDANDGNPDAETMAVLAKYPLWLAAYVVNPSAFLPPEWMTAGYTLWQDAGDVGDIDRATPGQQLFHIPGIGGGKVNVDHDVFNGSLDELKAFLRALAPRPILTPPEHDDVPLEPEPPKPIEGEFHTEPDGSTHYETSPVTEGPPQLSLLARLILWITLFFKSLRG